MGHEDLLPPHPLNARCPLSQATFAGVRGNGRDAPITDVPICSVCKMRLLALGSKIKATASFNRPPITSSEVFFVEGDELFERLSDRLRLIV